MTETNEEPTMTTLFQMSDKTYDVLKGLVQYVLPGLATLYLALAALWSLPYGEPIAGTITAITTFLGIIVGISKRKFVALQPGPAGDLLVDMGEEGQQLLTVALEKPLGDVRGQDTITFNVVTNDGGDPNTESRE